VTTFPLEAINGAVEASEHGGVGKAVLVME
jgi:hypothetical protein